MDDTASGSAVPLSDHKVRALLLALPHYLRSIPKETLGSTDRHVLSAMASFADPDGGSVFPSVATVEAITGLSRRSVQQARARLIDLGVLKVVQRGGSPDALTDVTVYKISLRKLKHLASLGGAPRAPGGRTTCARGAHHVRGGGAPDAPNHPIEQPIEQPNDHNAASFKADGHVDDDDGGGGAPAESIDPFVSRASNESPTDADRVVARRCAKTLCELGGWSKTAVSPSLGNGIVRTARVARGKAVEAGWSEAAPIDEMIAAAFRLYRDKGIGSPTPSSLASWVRTVVARCYDEWTLPVAVERDTRPEYIRERDRRALKFAEAARRAEGRTE